MDVRKEVQKVWQSWSNRDRRILRSYAKGSPEAANPTPLRHGFSPVLSVLWERRRAVVGYSSLGLP